VLVSDEELGLSTALMTEKTRTLVEPAGAAPLAAALHRRQRLAGRSVALLCTGGNIAPAQLVDLLAAPRPAAAAPAGTVMPFG
jgi:threonine dehydratase